MTENSFDFLIGKTVTEAEELFPNLRIRVTKRDNTFIICLRDYDENRLNVETVKNTIAKVTGLG